MSNTKEEELYVTIDYPDTRKRITVVYNPDSNDEQITNNENTINLVISNQIKTFSGLLNILINRYQIKSILKSKLVLKTVDGRRVGDLSQLYNNQMLCLTHSKLTTSSEYYDDLEEQNTKDKVKVIDQLELFTNDGEVNKNEFQRDIRKLKFQYQDQVVIGESYPYRCKINICQEDFQEMYFLYLIEPVSYGKTNEPFKSYIITSDSSRDLTKFTAEVDSKVNEVDIIRFVQKVIELYKCISKFSEEPVLDARIASLFNPNLKCQTTSSVTQLINDRYNKINYLVKYLDSPFSLIKNLLFKSKWNVKEVKFEHDKLKQLGTINCTHKTKEIHHYKFHGLMEGESKEIECSICYCDYDSKTEMVELLCGHRFCKGCLSNYFSCSVDEGNGNTSSICCPQIGCENKVIDEVTIESIVPGEKNFKIINNFLNDTVFTSGFKWCPSASCERIFNPTNKSPKDVLPFVLCLCRIPLCLYCGKSEFHWPLSCHLGKVESQSELENIEWIAKNCTPCPKCKNPVQKNMGCNHMTCSVCRNEFCYTCGQNYTGHSCINMNERKKVDMFISRYLGNSPAVANYLETKRKSFRDPVATLLYNNLMLSLFVKRLSKVKSQIEDFIMVLINVATGKTDTEEDDLVFKQTRMNYLRIAMEVATKTKDPNSGLGPIFPTVILDRSTASLSTNICLNGSQKVLLDNLIVFTQFYQFKVEITKQLKKLHNIDLDPSKIKLYNIHSAEIKSSQEILYKEKLYVCADKNEKLNSEPEYSEIIEEEDQEYIQLQVGQKNKKFFVLDEKKKYKSNIETIKKQQEKKSNILEGLRNLQNNAENQVQVQEEVEVEEEVVEEEPKVSSIRISTQEEMDTVESEINDLIKEFENQQLEQVCEEIFENDAEKLQRAIQQSVNSDQYYAEEEEFEEDYEEFEEYDDMVDNMKLRRHEREGWY